MTEPIRKLGPYTLISKIGHGAFGVVWLAEKQTAIATTRVALKLSRDENIDLEAFRQEAAIWVQASGHPNVLPLIDADIYDDRVVIVSEYVPDGSLAKWLKEHGGEAPSIEAACEMIEGILAGLAHLHEQRIIHRDLKPDNILLQRGTPRLADFGIARLLNSGSHSRNISGTLAYMAPEAFDGKRNERTDIWSVGVIFYEMLSGRLPYAHDDMPSFIGALMRYDPPPLPRSLPQALQTIVARALQRDSANRYTSAADMRRDLRKAERTPWSVERELQEAITTKLPEVAGVSVLQSEEAPNATISSLGSKPTNEDVPHKNESVSTVNAGVLKSTVAGIPLTQTATPETIAAQPPKIPITGKEAIEPTWSEEKADLVAPAKRSPKHLFWISGALVALILVATGIVLLVTRFSTSSDWVDTATNREADKANGVAARVNGKPIMLTEVNRGLSQQAGGKESQLSPIELVQARFTIVDKLIQREVLYQKAQHEKLLPSEDNITNSINKQKQESGMTNEEFVRQLNEQGMTMERIRDEAKKDLAIQRLQEKYSGTIIVHDQEVEDYYRANKQEFLNARGVGLAMIMVDPADNSSDGIQDDAKNEGDANRKIVAINQQLKAGADFATVARARSEDSNSVTKGGDIGFATEDDLKHNGFPAGLIAKFFGPMQVGDRTDPIRFASGKWYIFRLLDKRLRTEQLTLDSAGVREQITKKLIQQRKEVSDANLLTTATNESKIVNYLAMSKAEN